MYIELIYGLILFLNHYVSDFIGKKLYNHKSKIISFGAGVAVAYVILELLPQLATESLVYNENIFAIVLFGVISLHLVEKYFYQHSSRAQLRKQLKEIHSLGFFVYHFVLGMILTQTIQRGFVEGTFFFLILLFHTAVSGTSISEIHSIVTRNKRLKFMLASSTLLGVIVAIVFVVPHLIYLISLPYITGIILYTVFREAIPPGKKGSPVYFILGVVLFMLLIILARRYI